MMPKTQGADPATPGVNTMDETAAASEVAPPEARSPAAEPGIARDRLVRLAYRFLWNRDDAEDVAQEALLIAHEQADRLREAGTWWAWMSRIVVNRCHERGRRRRRSARRDASLRDAVRDRIGIVVDRTTSGTATIKDAVREALPELTRRQHEVVVLRHLQGMTYEEVGAVLGIAPATARVQARLGREALRKLLAKRSPELFDRMARKRESNEDT